MKNVLINLSYCLLLVTLIGGCKKDSPSDTVVNPPAKLQIDVKVDKDTIPQGGQVTFTWISTNAISCSVSLNGVKETIAGYGVKSYSLNQNTTFLFVFTANDSTTETKSFMIIVTEVIPPKAPTIHVSADPTQIPYNGVSIITITSTDADSVTSNLAGVHGSNGSFSTPSLQMTTSYNFKAWGHGGTAVDSLKIIVDPKPPMTRFEIITQPEGFNPVIEYREFPNGYRDTLTSFPNKLKLYIYRTDGTFSSYLISTGVMIGNGPWSFLENESKLQMGSLGTYVFDINSIVPNEMILSMVEGCTGCPFGETFIATYDYRLYTKK